MKKRIAKIFSLGLVITCVILFDLTGMKANRQENGVGTNIEANGLAASYQEWQTVRVSNGNGNLMTVALGWVKGVSAEHTKATGAVRLDLANGSVTVGVKELPEGKWNLWLINNIDRENSSTLPEAGDDMINVGSFQSNGSTAYLETKVDATKLSNFQIDRIAVTRAGQTPDQAFVLTGSPTLFERLHHQQLIDEKAAVAKNEQQGIIGSLLGMLSTQSASADGSSLDALIAKGREVFVKEKFSGNGRTCATCHPELNNFTLDPKFISILPKNDPLFVAENNPALSQNFENPAMMRKFGLILENPDGFDDLNNKFVLRSVNHTLGLTATIKAPDPQFGLDFTTNGNNPNPAQRLGWGGDGAPGAGTLREFAIGAITQHFPKSLNRVSGVDFRLPTDAELDAMEAFQLSLGRKEELNIRNVTLNDAVASSGKDLFLDTGFIGEPGHKNCNACHFNGGANAGFTLNPFLPGFTPLLDGNPLGFNGNQGTNVNGLPQVLTNNLPPDGGFGRIPLPPPFNSFGNFGFAPGVGTIPVEEFNSQSLLEAPDTAPYFHNHMVATLEESIAFYGTPAFQSPFSVGGPAGPIKVTISSNPNDPEVLAIGAFLRNLNAIENIRSSIALESSVVNANGASEVNVVTLARAARDTVDAITVLSSGAYKTSKPANVKNAITQLSLSLVHIAAATAKLPTKSSSITTALNSAKAAQRNARAQLVNPSTLGAHFNN